MCSICRIRGIYVFNLPKCDEMRYENFMFALIFMHEVFLVNKI